MGYKDAELTTPLKYAVQLRRIRIIPLLLSKSNVNEADKQGYTAVHTAIELKRYDILSMLMGSGQVQVNELDRYGDSLLKHAIRSGSKESVSILLSHGADPDYMGNNSPLSLAVKSSDPELVSMLVSAGAKYSPQDVHVLNLLELARQQRQLLNLESSLVEVRIDDPTNEGEPRGFIQDLLSEETYDYNDPISKKIEPNTQFSPGKPLFTLLELEK